MISLLIGLAPASQALTSSGVGEPEAVTDEPIGATALRSLSTWWSQSRTENYASGSEAGDSSARNAGYRFVRSEGLIQPYDDPPAAGGMAQVLSYWNPIRQDNFTTCSDAGVNWAGPNGYYLVRQEGWAWRTLADGRVPLYSFWHEGLQDMFVTATTAGQADALAAGYSFVRTECYIRV